VAISLTILARSAVLFTFPVLDISTEAGSFPQGKCVMDGETADDAFHAGEQALEVDEVSGGLGSVAGD
jgi:hypothetical protein